MDQFMFRWGKISRKCYVEWFLCIKFAIYRERWGGVGVERSPCMREIGVRSPVGPYPNRWWQLHCHTLGNRCKCHWSSEKSIIKDRITVGVIRYRTLTAQWPWVSSIGQNLQPAPAMVTSPWHMSEKILEWDKQNQAMCRLFR